MSTIEISRSYGRKLTAVALALGLWGVSFAQATELSGRAASPAAGAGSPAASAGSPAASAARRAGPVKLAKAKKRKKKVDADADTGSADTGGDSGGSGDDDESALLAAPKKKAPRAESDDEGRGSRTSESRASADDADDKPADHGRSAKAKVVKESAAPEPTSDEAAAATGTALEIGFGGMALFRQLAWTSDAQAAQLGPYTLTPGPEAGLWLEFFPAAFMTSGFASNIGLFARYAYGFGVKSGTANGTDVATSYQDFVAGLKLRLPLGTFTPFGTIAYGEQQFSLAPLSTPQDLPAMDYSFVRIGFGTRIQVSPVVGIDVGAAFITVTNAGSGPNQLASMPNFPQAAAYAVEGGASLALRIASKVAIRAGADIRQYGISLNPQSGGRQVTGAVDRYVVAWSGLEVVLDGLGAGSAGSDDEAAPAPKQRRRHADDESSDDDSKKSSDSSDDQ